MDHGHMDHGGHMEPMCNMNMLFTWDTTDLCIIFKSWHVHSTASLFGYLFLVVVLTAGYELVREMSRRYETASSAERSVALDTTDDHPSSHSWLGRVDSNVMFGRRRNRIVKAAFYAVQVFYSFFIMLLFMTYNGWIMLAVAAGAFLGYIAFGNSSATKSVACH